MAPVLPDASVPLSVPSSEFDPVFLPDPASCPFCKIADNYPPYDPETPPSTTSSSLNPDATLPGPSTFVVLSTPLVIAFLDIMPLSHGHLLLCSRAHRPKLSDISPSESIEIGKYLPILSAALSKATGIKDWNVVQNNGAAAAQVVPHMHFHIIPRPDLKDARRDRFTGTMFGRGAREDLDEEEAAPLAERIRQALATLLREADQKPKL